MGGSPAAERLPRVVNVTDIHSLTEFGRHAKSLTENMRASESPLGLMVNGRPAVVVQDAEAHRALVERQRQREDLAAIREGPALKEAGGFRPTSEALSELEGNQALQGGVDGVRRLKASSGPSAGWRSSWGSRDCTRFLPGP